MLRHCRCLLGSLALCAGVAQADGSLRCGGRLVSVGDARIDLLGRCGEPTLRERRLDERWEVVTDGIAGQGLRITLVVEEWTYDFGPRSFAQRVRLSNGRIIGIERLDYGYVDPAPRPARIPRARCDPDVLRPGDAKLDLLARCGEPAMVDAWEEVHVSFVTGSGRAEREPRRAVGESLTVQVEVWVYDAGPDRFVRFVRLENGRVTGVSTGTYGYGD